MANKLEQAKQKLQFVGRALGCDYIDGDTLDELGREVYQTIQLLNEIQQGQQQELPLDIPNCRVTVYEPLEA